MRRYQILHQTTYRFSDYVQLLPHTLRLRPREGHELRIERSALEIVPAASLRWHRDVEGNCVATAVFNDWVQVLTIASEVVIQQYDSAPQDFLIADYAVDYPFHYSPEDLALLTPYLSFPYAVESALLTQWVSELWRPNEWLQTFALLQRLNQCINRYLRYCRREEEGVQSAEQTLRCRSGSCRDYASLFMAAARHLGFAARFVSGYLYSGVATAPCMPGSTHAWAEVFIPGAGWKGFDATTGTLVGAEHIAVAVARLPEAVPPIAGAFHGVPGTSMVVDVWVNELGAV